MDNLVSKKKLFGIAVGGWVGLFVPSFLFVLSGSLWFFVVYIFLTPFFLSFGMLLGMQLYRVRFWPGPSKFVTIVCILVAWPLAVFLPYGVEYGILKKTINSIPAFYSVQPSEIKIEIFGGDDPGRWATKKANFNYPLDSVTKSSEQYSAFTTSLIADGWIIYESIDKDDPRWPSLSKSTQANITAFKGSSRLDVYFNPGSVFYKVSR